MQDLLINNNEGYIEMSFDQDANAFEIVGLHVKEQRKGIGSKLVKIAIEHARSQNKNIFAWAEPEDEDIISLDDLCSFYTKLGFYVGEKEGSYARIEFNF